MPCIPGHPEGGDSSCVAAFGKKSDEPAGLAISIRFVAEQVGLDFPPRLGHRGNGISLAAREKHLCRAKKPKFPATSSVRQVRKWYDDLFYATP